MRDKEYRVETDSGFYNLMDDKGDFLLSLQEQLPLLAKILEEKGAKAALRTFFNLVHNDTTFDCVFFPVQTILGTI